tara:strand:+ start:27651 stop:28316 length:666 start_codon:yes stop_codon:yes gene_type:complete
MGYIFYRIVLLNGVNKNVYKKENSIKLYCRLNGKMIDIKKYKKLCKPPKKSKAKPKSKSKPKPKANAKAKSKRKRQMKGGFFGIGEFFNNLFSGKSKNEKDLEDARNKYDKLKTEGETICSDATKKTQEAQKEVFRLEAAVNHEKEQKRLKEKANETQNQEQSEPQAQQQRHEQLQNQSIAINRDSPLKNTSTTQPYVMKGGKAKKPKKVKKDKKAKKVKK